MIAGITLPDSPLVREAEALVRRVSDAILYNHVMRCYFFAELFARKEGIEVDHELMFLSAVLHDLGMTPEGEGPYRFEIEGASAARRFLTRRGVAAARAQSVWDNIALHTWDMNFFRDDTSRIMQLGVALDVYGVEDHGLEPEDIAAVVEHYPRLGFKRAFGARMEGELAAKQPYPHLLHMCTRLAHHNGDLTVPDLTTFLGGAPFGE